MFMMNQRMTHRTQNLQILNTIIISISIFMMDTKNVFHRIISTNFTTIHHSFFNHFFSNRSENRIPGTTLIFSYAFSRTIFSFLRCMTPEFFCTMMALIFCISSVLLRNVKAFSRAIFSFIASSRNMFKFIATYCTICFNTNRIRYVFARSGTILKILQSVFWKKTLFIASQTYCTMSFNHATT